MKEPVGNRGKQARLPRIRRILPGALKPWHFLLLCYAFFSLLRIFLDWRQTLTPEIQPDSSLYLQLSHSILKDGALLFRGQPIRYEYILYPLLLSPLHWLPGGVSVFRAAQALNALMMNLSVFPAYALARRICESRKTAAAVALLTLLMPDFFMTRHVMAESVGFPLILFSFYVFSRFLEDPPRPLTAVLLGATGFLLYALKPGYAAVPGSFLLITLWQSVRGRQRQRLVHAGIAAAAFVLLALLLRLLLLYGLGMAHGLPALYEVQTHPLSWDHLLQSLNGLFLYAAYVPMAFTFWPLIFPAAHAGAFGGKERSLLLALLLALLLMVLGTVYIIYYDELAYTDSPYHGRIHARYLAAFLPVLTAFLFSPRLESRGLNTPLAAGLAFSLSAVTLLGPMATGSGVSHPVDALLLAAATGPTAPLNGRLLWPVFYLAFLLTAAFLIHRRGWGRSARRLAGGALLVSFLLNGAAAGWQHRYHQASPYPAEAREALALAEGRPGLGVVLDGSCFWPAATELDLASRFELPLAELDDVIANTAADGSIPSFLPKACWMEQPVRPVPAPGALVLDAVILNRVLLAEPASRDSRRTRSAAYTVVSLPAGRPWIHSGLSGFEQTGWVQEGSRFTLFDPVIRAKGTVTLHLQARAGEGEATLLLKHGGQTAEIPLSQSLSWYQGAFSVERPEEAFTVFFSVRGGNGQAYIQTYLVE